MPRRNKSISTATSTKKQQQQQQQQVEHESLERQYNSAVCKFAFGTLRNERECVYVAVTHAEPNGVTNKQFDNYYVTSTSFEIRKKKTSQHHFSRTV